MKAPSKKAVRTIRLMCAVMGVILPLVALFLCLRGKWLMASTMLPTTGMLWFCFTFLEE